MTPERLDEIGAAEIAERIRTQDNAGTSHPYFVVYDGDSRKPRARWQFVSAFLTRDSAEAFVLGQRHNLRRPFIFVESAHNNHEIRAARKVFAALPELLAEVARLIRELDEARANAERYAADIRRVMDQRDAERARAEKAEAERDELARWKETHSWSSTLRTRAETAEARVRELETAIAEWAQAHDGTDYSVQVAMNGRLRAVGMRSRKEG